MSTAVALCALLPPVALWLFSAFSEGDRRDPSLVADRATRIASLSLVLSLIIAAAVLLLGPARGTLVVVWGIGLSVHLDALGAVMLVLIGFVGLVVIRYSRNYLSGDPGHARFIRWLVLTLAAVQLLVVSGNLALLVLAWVAIGLGLGKLLRFYPERPAAQRATRKMFLASSLGDLCLVAAAALLWARYGTLELADLVAAARQDSAPAGWSVTIAAFLIVATATLKSAQLPFHGWLLEVMETPTPVSALLHAGVINAGGFLLIRLAEILLLAQPALAMLAVIGGATALFGSLVMLTQTSVKVQLACSTIAQMGFMLLQCGLGAFSSALLHIAAHSLYKAHAFLSSGSVMDLARASWRPRPGEQPHPARLVVALVAAFILTLGIAAVFGLTPQAEPAKLALGCILLMGLVHLIASAIDERPDAFVVTRVVITSAAVAALYFALQEIFARLLEGSIPVGERLEGATELTIAGLVVLAFAAITLFQNQWMRRAESTFWVAAYVHTKNGFYLNTLANRLVLAWWPRRPAGRWPGASRTGK